MSPIDKPVALVTGSSRGIGRAVAIRLAADGFVLALNGRKPLEPDNAEKGAFEVLKTIEQAGGQAEFFQADVSSSDARRAMLESIDETFGRIDLLVNNAGIEPPFCDLLESDEERYDHVMSVNLKGPYFLTQQVANRMIAGREKGIIAKGRICFITSVQAYMSNPLGAEYCMTKAALSMASRCYAHRLGEYDIPVLELCPGVTHSDMADRHRERIDQSISEGWLVTSRWGEPEEVAELVADFARGHFDYCTGSRIEIGGGLGMNRL